MVEFARVALFLVVGFCIGTVVVGSASTYLAKPTDVTFTSTAFNTTTLQNTVTETNAQTSLLTSTVTLTSLSTTTSTVATTSYLTTASTVSTTITSAITQSSTTTLLATSTVTETSLSTITETNNATGSTSAVEIANVYGNTDQNYMFSTPTGTITLEWTTMQLSPGSSFSLAWYLNVPPNYGTVAQGSYTGAGPFSATISGLVPDGQYVLELLPSNAYYNLEILGDS